MAQIVVRGIDDKLMSVFKKQAKRRGQSVEQAVRELIEAAARDAMKQWNWSAEVAAFRERLRMQYGELPDSTADIREGRDHR
jgi:plasmid stability protein